MSTYGSVAPYVEPEPYATLDLGVVHAENNLTFVEEAETVVSASLGTYLPYGSTYTYVEAVPYAGLLTSRPSASEDSLTFVEEAEVIISSENNLTFVEGAETVQEALPPITYLPYGSTYTYVDPIPYVGLYAGTHEAENSLTFVQDSDIGLSQGEDILSLSQLAEIVWDTSNDLTLSYSFDADASDSLTFSQLAVYTREASNTLTFTGSSEYISAVVDQALVFSDSADHVRDGKDSLTFVQESGIISGSEDQLTFTSVGAVVHGGEDTLAFVEEALATLPTNSPLVFVQEAEWVVAIQGTDSLVFVQEVTWTRARTRGTEAGLRFFQLASWTGGTPHIPTPRYDHVLVGSVEARVSEAYTTEKVFTNGKYLNAGTKISLELGRPLGTVGDWQLVLRDLVGTQQTIQNLMATDIDVYVTAGSRLTSEGMTLVFFILDYDTRGVI